MSLLKKVLPIIVAVSLLAACGSGGGGGSNDDPGASAATVRGSFVIPAGSAGLTSQRAVTGLTGTVIVTIGDNQVIIPASNITLTATNDYLVQFMENVDVDGITVITCTSALVADSIPVVYAGYLMTAIAAGSDTNINGDDASAPITELDPTGFTATAAPTVNTFVVNNPSTGALVTGVTASLSQLENDCVYIRVNNAYRPLSVTGSAVGTGYVSTSITLVPGANQVQIFAINSKGFTASEVKTVNCTAASVAGKENFLFTLTWDNLSDIDLHTFYYATTPTSTTAYSTWHNYFGSRNHPSDDSIVSNLDVDNTYGYGPEHFTLLGAADGYYIVAVDAYDIDFGIETVNAFVTIQGNTANKSYGPFAFSVEDGMDDIATLNSSGAWHRVADIKVTNGVATILPPNTAITPKPMSSSYDNLRAAASKK